jgi:hypothetical protein
MWSRHGGTDLDAESAIGHDDRADEEGALGGAVCGDAGKPEETSVGADVDNRSTLLRDHGAQCFASDND